MPVIATATTTTFALKALAPLIGSAGLAGFLFTATSMPLLFTKGAALPTEDFLKLGISDQRVLLKALLMQLHPIVPQLQNDCHHSHFPASICEVCLEEVDNHKMSLIFAPCGHRCVCDDCDRDIIVIKLSACVTQQTIAGDAPLDTALKQLLDPSQKLASTFPRTDRCVKCNTLAQRQYSNNTASFEKLSWRQQQGQRNNNDNDKNSNTQRDFELPKSVAWLFELEKAKEIKLQSDTSGSRFFDDSDMDDSDMEHCMEDDYSSHDDVDVGEWHRISVKKAKVL